MRAEISDEEMTEICKKLLAISGQLYEIKNEHGLHMEIVMRLLDRYIEEW